MSELGLIKGISNEKISGNKQVAEVFLDGKAVKAELVDDNVKGFGMFMHSLILSNYTTISIEKGSGFNITEDTNEDAISLFTLNKGFDKKLIDQLAPKITQLDYVSDIDVRPSVHMINEKYRIVAKGSPIDILQRCSYVLLDSKVVNITRKVMREINSTFWSMVGRDLKVVALAIKDLADFSRIPDSFDTEKEMTFVALVGIGKA